ncbi:MAG: TIR domain-containing protein, partial [Halobacteriota archaeon]
MLNAYSRLFMQHDVFISYAEENKQIANTICAELEKLGFHCWIAPRDITPGTSWAQSIVQAIDESRSMVLIFSSWANSSPHVLREAEQAVRISTPIVPFRVEDVEPSDELGYFIRTPHWLNAMTPPYEQYIFELADALKILLDSEVPCSEESKSYKKPKSTPESKSVFNSLFPQQNPYFTGREAILEDLHESLTANKKGAWKQAITGMGGVGKTQLAAEYAYQY